MDKTNPHEVAAAMVRLGAWNAIAACNFALKLNGAEEPFFVSIVLNPNDVVAVAVLYCRGWREFHNYIGVRQNTDVGVVVSHVDIDHLSLVVSKTGNVELISCKTGYVPVKPNDAELKDLAKLLYETYGLMMRFESNPELGMIYADDRAMFSRVERDDGKWEDAPYLIPAPPKYVEAIKLNRSDLTTAADLPFDSKKVWEIDFFRMPGEVKHSGGRPLALYLFAAVDAETGNKVIWEPLTVTGEQGLLAVWEKFASRILTAVIETKAVPGEIRIRSTRMMRFVRPLGMQLPFKIKICSSLGKLDGLVTTMIKEHRII